ncbi:DUF4160 domain-containing protein [Sulfurivirga sp.]|uniref:DUF4160 domain-containing protein n=1 Tax=Sulfurivirga sp. TaxID=2614236 RepID=UPI00345C365F
MHIHVLSEKGEAKFWLEPEIALARNFRFSPRELAEIEGIIRQHEQEFRDAWCHHFPGTC